MGLLGRWWSQERRRILYLKLLLIDNQYDFLCTKGRMWITFLTLYVTNLKLKFNFYLKQITFTDVIFSENESYLALTKLDL